MSILIINLRGDKYVTVRGYVFEEKRVEGVGDAEAMAEHYEWVLAGNLWGDD